MTMISLRVLLSMSRQLIPAYMIWSLIYYKHVKIHINHHLLSSGADVVVVVVVVVVATTKCMYQTLKLVLKGSKMIFATGAVTGVSKLRRVVTQLC